MNCYELVNIGETFLKVSVAAFHDHFVFRTTFV